MIETPPAPTPPPPAALPPRGKIAAFRRSPWLAYALSAVLILVMLLAPLALGLVGDDPPTIVLLTVPIILSAAAGGLGAGLATTMVTALLTNYFLLPPLYSFSIASGLYSIQWLELIAAGVLISVLCEGLLRSRRRAEASQQLQAITLASIGDAVITTDAQGRITLLNSEAERLTGWRSQDALGQPSAS
jgi:K+-sensing histidine kinase KdpD